MTVADRAGISVGAHVRLRRAPGASDVGPMLGTVTRVTGSTVRYDGVATVEWESGSTGRHQVRMLASVDAFLWAAYEYASIADELSDPTMTLDDLDYDPALPAFARSLDLPWPPPADVDDATRLLADACDSRSGS